VVPLPRRPGRAHPAQHRQPGPRPGPALRRAGVAASAHQLRHWFGTQTLRAAGGNLRTAQELLRHADANTTAGYTKVDDADRRAAILALPGSSPEDTQLD
jgi:integrase/recombinase XerD